MVGKELAATGTRECKPYLVNTNGVACNNWCSRANHNLADRLPDRPECTFFPFHRPRRHRVHIVQHLLLRPFCRTGEHEGGCIVTRTLVHSPIHLRRRHPAPGESHNHRHAGKPFLRQLLRSTSVRRRQSSSLLADCLAHHRSPMRGLAVLYV